jgi:uncharacterized protein YciI
MPHFFIKLTAPRPTFAADMNETETKIMQDHARYWRQRQDAGEVLMFGPVLDPKGPYGIGVVALADEVAARDFAGADPAMMAKAGFACEIHPMRAVTRDNTK